MTVGFDSSFKTLLLYLVCYKMMYPSHHKRTRAFLSICLPGHYFLIFEALGHSLYDIIKRNDYTSLPLRCVQSVSKQLLEALVFLHSANLIHAGWYIYCWLIVFGILFSLHLFDLDIS